MARHGSSRRSGEFSLRLLIAAIGCLIMGVFALGLGPYLLHSPATCDYQVMSELDLCRHGHRGSERLIVDGVLFGGEGNTRDDQIRYNRIAGPIALVVGAAFVVGSVYLLREQYLAAATRRRDRRSDAPGDERGGPDD